MIDVLGKLFGSAARVKIMRLMLANKDERFDIADVVKRTKVRRPTALKELNALAKIKLLRASGSGKSRKWLLNKNCDYARALESLVLGPEGSDAALLTKKIGGTKGVKLVVVTGVLVPDAIDSEVDLLIVGDNVTKRGIAAAIADVEASLGREMRFALFDSADFAYRMDIGDRLVRDVFDFPHEVLVDKLG